MAREGAGHRMHEVQRGKARKRMHSCEHQAKKRENDGASLVVQWLKIRLPMQGTQVRALVREDPTCSEQLSPRATTPEAQAPRACALHQEKPPQ